MARSRTNLLARRDETLARCAGCNELVSIDGDEPAEVVLCGECVNDAITPTEFVPAIEEFEEIR